MCVIVVTRNVSTCAIKHTLQDYIQKALKLLQQPVIALIMSHYWYSNHAIHAQTHTHMQSS